MLSASASLSLPKHAKANGAEGNGQKKRKNSVFFRFFLLFFRVQPSFLVRDKWSITCRPPFHHAFPGPVLIVFQGFKKADANMCRGSPLPKESEGRGGKKKEKAPEAQRGTSVKRYERCPPR